MTEDQGVSTKFTRTLLICSIVSLQASMLHKSVSILVAEKLRRFCSHESYKITTHTFLARTFISADFYTAP